MKFVTAMAVLGMSSAVPASPATTGRFPAPPGEIAAGAQSCVAATTSGPVDVAVLKSNGWNEARVSADGKTVATPMTFFGKGNLLLITDKNETPATCFITAKIVDIETFGDVAYALDGTLGVPGAAKPNETDTIYWFPRARIVQLTKTGTAKAPAVRVAVSLRPK